MLRPSKSSVFLTTEHIKLAVTGHKNCTSYKKNHFSCCSDGKETNISLRMDIKTRMMYVA